MQISPRDRVSLDYAYIGEGETVNGGTCPSCGGGVSGDRSLSVSRKDGVLLWICYRATCRFAGSSGRSTAGTVSNTSVPSSRAVAGRWIARDADSLPVEIREMLSTRYSIDPSLAARGGFGWSATDSRLTMPVRSYEGEELGVMLRALDGRKPKVVSHTEKGAMAWYTNHTTPGIIIVEDQLSAVRASRYLSSVALLGTNLSEERVAEIRRTRNSPVYLALDNDAIVSAVRYVIKYRSTLPMQLVRLDKDIKDMTHEEADALFAGLAP